MNEMLLLVQLFIAVLFTMVALRFGKEALIALISLQCVLANLYVLKQYAYIGGYATCGDPFAISQMLGITLLQSNFGKETAKKAVWISFGLSFFFLISSQVHLAFTPSNGNLVQEAYQVIFNPAPRLLLASMAAVFVSQFLNVALFGFLKKFITSIGFVSLITLAVCQLLDTVVFAYLGLYGIMDHLPQVVLANFSLKIALVALTPLFLRTARFFIKLPSHERI